jgi:hypothetical protein
VKLVFIRCNTRHADGLEIINRGAETDNARDIGCASLELVGQVVVDRLVEGDFEDHIAATLPRRHGLKQRLTSVQHARARWPEHLVPGERVEVATEFLHVNIQVWYALGAIDEYGDAAHFGMFNDLAYRAHGAQCIRHMRHAYEKGLVIDEIEHCIELNLALVIDRRNNEFGASLLADQLPGNDVGVVLEVSDDDFVTRMQARTAEALRDEIYRLCCAAREHDLTAGVRVNEIDYLVTRSFV